MTAVRVVAGWLLLLLVLLVAFGAIDSGPVGIVFGIVLLLVFLWQFGPWPREIDRAGPGD